MPQGLYHALPICGAGLERLLQYGDRGILPAKPLMGLEHELSKSTNRRVPDSCA